MKRQRVGRNGHINRSYLPEGEWTGEDRRRLIDLFGDEIRYELCNEILPLLYRGDSNKKAWRIVQLVEALQIINIGAQDQLEPYNSGSFIEQLLPLERDEFCSYGRCVFELAY